MKLRRNQVAVQPVAAPAPAPVIIPAPDPVAVASSAMRSGRLGELVQRVIYDRLLLDPPAGGTSLTRLQFELFTHNRATNPELTNLVEGQRMGPNESFVVEAVAIQANFGCTEAGLTKLLQDARLRIGVGPDDVERLSVPAVFLPSGNGGVAGLTTQIHNGFYRLAKGQEINLQAGHPFSVRLIEGPNATSLADAEVVDVIFKLFGTYQQGIVR